MSDDVIRMKKRRRLDKETIWGQVWFGEESESEDGSACFYSFAP
jgi:hypothetical protein